MRFALSFNIIHTPPHEEEDANHQATCISERCIDDMRIRALQMVSQSAIKQLLQQSKPCRQGYIQQSAERRQRANRSERRGKERRKREKRETMRQKRVLMFVVLCRQPTPQKAKIRWYHHPLAPKAGKEKARTNAVRTSWVYAEQRKTDTGLRD